jgi:Ca-activated chloride channel family protein
LTDGVNNAGFIEPETAADIAKTIWNKSIYYRNRNKRYGRISYAVAQMVSFFQMMKVEIDDKLMKSMLKTGRALSNSSSVIEIYGEINKWKLQNRRVEVL